MPDPLKSRKGLRARKIPLLERSLLDGTRAPNCENPELALTGQTPVDKVHNRSSKSTGISGDRTRLTMRRNVANMGAIAQKLGISKTTVHYALRDTGRVSESMRKRVRQVAAE